MSSAATAPPAADQSARRRPSYYLTAQEITAAVAAFEREGKATVVARQLGRSVGAVRRALARAGLTLHPGGFRRRLTPEETAAALASYATTRSARQTAADLGFGLHATRRALLAAGALLPRCRISAAARERILRLYEETGSLDKVAANVGFSRHAVYLLVRDHGKVRRPVPRWPISLAREGAALYRRGLSVPDVRAQLAQQHGTAPLPSLEWFRDRFRAMGILRTLSQAQRAHRLRRSGRDFAALADQARALFAARPCPVATLARKLGVSNTTVRNWLTGVAGALDRSAASRAGWRLSRGFVAARKARIDVVRMRLAGATFEQIKTSTGCSSSTIALYLADAGVPRVKPPNVSPAQLAEIARLRGCNMSTTAIAQAVGLATTTVNRHLARLRAEQVAQQAGQEQSPEAAGL